MTNDSGLFRTREKLEEQEGTYPTGGNIFGSPDGDWVPLYEGKMVQAFDHRAADIVVNIENRHRPAQAVAAQSDRQSDSAWLPDPQFWVPASEVPWPKAEHSVETDRIEWAIGFKDVTAPTNMRTMIAAIIPATGVGNTLPLIAPNFPPEPDPDDDGTQKEYPSKCADWARAYIDTAPLMLANFNATIFDFVARQKVQGQHLNWLIVEQLPVVNLAQFFSDRVVIGFSDQFISNSTLMLGKEASTNDGTSFQRSSSSGCSGYRRRIFAASSGVPD